MFLQDLDSALGDLRRWREDRERDAAELSSDDSSKGVRPETDDTLDYEEAQVPPLVARTADEKAVSVVVLCLVVWFIRRMVQITSLHELLLLSSRRADSDDEDLKEGQRNRSEQERMFHLIEQQVGAHVYRYTHRQLFSVFSGSRRGGEAILCGRQGKLHCVIYSALMRVLLRVCAAGVQPHSGGGDGVTGGAAAEVHGRLRSLRK